ncbi:MAG TPA: class I SAM-dependent methyltransferase, partial [Longimicrobiaceae bacterium]|nr:class I SAM-dependent methyltransferase [Longimicrobiaceae bacterium]
PGRVVGVDVNQRSLEFARQKSVAAGLANAEFRQADALALAMPSESFAMVYCNNVTSFIRDRDAAVREYYRVLEPGGYLAAVPIYYHRTPPAPLLAAVEEAVGAPLSVRGKQDVYDLFHSPSSTLFFDQDYEYVPQTAARMEEHANEVMSQSVLDEFPTDAREAMAERLAYFYRLFDENLTYARFCILIYRKHAPVAGRDQLENEPILYRARQVEERSA